MRSNSHTCAWDRKMLTRQSYINANDGDRVRRIALVSKLEFSTGLEVDCALLHTRTERVRRWASTDQIQPTNRETSSPNDDRPCSARHRQRRQLGAVKPLRIQRSRRIDARFEYLPESTLTAGRSKLSTLRRCVYDSLESLTKRERF